LSLVPLPAAMMATATRGAVAGEFVAGTVGRVELPFDFVFVIGLNILRLRSNGYFPGGSPLQP
jgi:hypothetical protein